MAVAVPSPQLPTYVPRRHSSGYLSPDSSSRITSFSSDDYPRSYGFGEGLRRSGSTEAIRKPYSFGEIGTGAVSEFGARTEVVNDRAYPSTDPGLASAPNGKPKVSRSEGRSMAGDLAKGTPSETSTWAYPSTYPGTTSASCGKPKALMSEDRSMVFTSLMMAAQDMQPANKGLASATSSPSKVSYETRQVDKFASARLCLPHIVPSSVENKIVLERITALLRDPAKLANIVRQCFRMVDVTGQGIDVTGLMNFRQHISVVLEIPEINSGDASRQYLRFGLRGQGQFQESEAYLLVKSFLRDHCKKLGDCTLGISIIDGSPAESGYQLFETVGGGNQCIARRATDREGRACCIKTYDKGKMNAVDVDALKTEFEVLQRLGTHSSIARAFQLFEDAQFYYMTFELYQGGDFTTLKEAATKANALTDDAWWQGVFRQCFEGLGYIHGNAFMHCDIKESNLMLKSEAYQKPEVVIIDFGFVQGSILDSTVISGTPGYIPPETWASGRFFPQGDVFAMGVVIMQMLLDKVPPHHDPPEGEVLPSGIFTDGVSLIKAVGTATRTRTPPFNLMAKQWPVLTQLTRRLLAKDVLKRPCVREVLRDVWFASEPQVVILPRYL